MVDRNSSDFHVDYRDVTQHWHPQSQRYAGGDSLLTALDEGWEMSDTIVRREHWFAGMRSVTVYQFEMTRGDEKMTMSVINTPYVTRLIRESSVRVIDVDHIKDRKTAAQD